MLKAKCSAAALATGPKGLCGRDAHIVGLGHRRDLLGFPQPATMAEIGLDDMARLLLKDFAEAKARDNALACGDGHGRGPTHLGQRIDILRRHRLLDKVGSVGRQAPGKIRARWPENAGRGNPP